VIFEIVLLALGSAVRPTSLAAVSALLSRESRQRLMLAYVTGGLAFALLFGLVVVGVFHGVHVNAGTDRTRAVADIAGGVLLVLFGIAVLTRTVPRRRKDPSREVGGALTARLDHEITVRVAALAGPLTHIPGIFYLVALNIIVAHNPTLPGGVRAVAIYDAIWFAVPIAALVLCIVDPDAAQKVVVAVEEWTRQHSRTIVPATSFVVGVALVIRGVLSA
jgi:small neutral amino acid transporter SnatA (MarC family)